MDLFSFLFFFLLSLFCSVESVDVHRRQQQMAGQMAEDVLSLCPVVAAEAPYIALGAAAGTLATGVQFPTALNIPTGKSPRTITMMINYTVATIAATPMLMSMSDNACNAGNEAIIYLTPSGTQGLLTFGSCNRGSWPATIAIPSGTWFHAAISYDGVSYVTLTLNAIAPLTWTFNVGVLSTVTSTFVLGQRYLAGSNPYQGWMDNIHIYNRVLSLNELYEDLSGNMTLSGLVGAWDGTLTPNYQLKDLTTNGNNGIFEPNICATANGGCDLLRPCTPTPGSRLCGACPTNFVTVGLSACGLAPPAPYITLGAATGSGASAVQFPTSTNIPSGNSARTITMMINFTLATFAGGATPALLSLSDGLCNAGNEAFLVLSATGALTLTSCNKGTWPVTSVYPSGTWFHAAFTYNGAGVVTLTLNGLAALTWTWSIGSFSTATSTFVLGERFTTGTNYYQGWMDNVHIYNRALSLSDINGDMNGNMSISGLVGAWDGTLTPNNQLKDLTTSGNNGIFVFNSDGTAPGAGALTQIVLYTSAGLYSSNLVGLQTTFGGTTYGLLGVSSATQAIVTIQPGEYIVQITSWYSGSVITGIKFVTSAGNNWGPYGQTSVTSNVQGNGQTSSTLALVGISGTYSPAGVVYPLKFAWGTSPYAANTMSGGNFDINCNCALARVQTMTFFLYNGPGTPVPNYVCGFELSALGYPSIIAGVFAWPDMTGTITTQTITVPPTDMLNKWNIVVCNIAPGVTTFCGVTIISIAGIQWTVGTTIAQAQNFSYVPVNLNYGQTALANQCNNHGIYGPYATVVQNGYTLSYFIQPALHD